MQERNLITKNIVNSLSKLSKNQLTQIYNIILGMINYNKNK